MSSSVVGSPGGSGLGIKVTLDSETSAGFSCGGDSSKFSVLVVGVGNPVDSGVVPDSIVGGVNHDNLVVFVCSVLADPVAVEHSQSSESTASTFLSLGSEVSGGLELVDTNGSGLAGDNTLGHGSLSSSSSNSDSVDNVALLGLEAELAGLFGTRGVVDSGDDWELSVFPGPDSEDEVHQVTLFLAPKFFKVLVGSHSTN